MSSTIKLQQITHFNTSTLGHTVLLAINAILLIPIGLLVLTPSFGLAAGLSQAENLFAFLMLIGLVLVPISLLLSTYFVTGDPLVCPVCIVVAVYNFIVAIFLFGHVANSTAVDAVDAAYSTIIGMVAVLNTLALLSRLREERGK